MNRAQKLLQPLIDRQRKRKSEGGFAGGHSLGALDGLEEAQRTLATLTDDIALADVPAVEWDEIMFRDQSGSMGFKYKQWKVYHPSGIDGMSNVYDNTEFRFTTHETAQAKRYVEIRIHLAALERKLLAELAGGV